MIAASPERDEAPGCPGLDRSAEWDQVAALRGEILGADRLPGHAVELARALGPVSTDVSASRLRDRIVAARTTIARAYAALSNHAQARRRATPAEEWLLDNSHIVSEQLREIEEDLPWGYLTKLPRLTTGAMRGYPRVYGLCLDYLRHTDARLDPETLANFVDSFQTVSPLSIGELWAVAILLRLGLILTTGAIAAGDVDALSRARVEKIASRLEAAAAEQANSGTFEPSDERPSDRPSSEQEQRRAHVRQASDQVTVGNAITSMRTIAALDWNKFFERTSLVEKILARDPGGVYESTDEASRDRYRHVIEELAEGSKKDERDVASAALELCRTAERDTPEAPWAAHVGHYLVGEGKPFLQAAIGYRPNVKDRAVEAVLRRPGSFYFGAIGVLSLSAWAAFVRNVVQHGIPAPVGIALACFAAVPITEIVIALVNALVVGLLPPRILPKLALRDGIGAARRTLVVVPALIEGERSLDDLLERLEVRALANPDEHLHFALLTDFPDADVAERPAEPGLVERAKRGIAKLNAGSEKNRFFLFHRRRLHNPQEGVWMGWERKRGKLEELNRLLRGARVEETTFSVVTAPLELLRTTRYVITLDADTELPRDTARELVAAIAHPINRPRWDVQGRRIGGYGVVQPRVGTLPKSSRRSRFARITAGPPGIDPYTTAISDVYQDLFASGSYVGKAIYDVEAFCRALDGRVPENRLLSHDLFEGIFARTALANDIELLDDQPSSYAAVAARQHRWIRGDFQLAPWLMPRVPTGGGGTVRSDLPTLGRWKLFDNLRRALVSPSLVALAITGWLSGPSIALAATTAVFFLLTAPLYGRVASSVLRVPVGKARTLGPMLHDLWASMGQLLLNAIFLFDEALVCADAIVRTGYRMLVSKRRLLEWRTAGQTERFFRGKIPIRIWSGAALSLAVGSVVGAVALGALPFAVPFLVLWVTAPGWALFLARPENRRRAAVLLEGDRVVLRQIALKTWRFFEDFVGQEDHFLPPDNYQEDPLGVVAHRTSPTNIGLYLLSVVAARDFGLLGLSDVADRIGRTLGTLDRLDKHNGHILNWYDTATLKPLDPQYVSTVDSGNLVAYLWTIHEACSEFLRAPIATEEAFVAIREMLRLARLEAKRTKIGSAEAALEEKLDEMVAAGPRSIEIRLDDFDSIWAGLDRTRAEISQSKKAGNAGSYWLDRARSLVETMARETRELAPWAGRLRLVPELVSSGPTASLWNGIATALSGAESIVRVLEAIETSSELLDELAQKLASLSVSSSTDRETASAYLGKLRSELAESRAACTALVGALDGVGDRARALADGMNFGFLYDEDRSLFSIGYNVQNARLDRSHYDLLASEARLASFVAIAKGDVELDHWFRLGRALSGLPDGRALWSWSGSMFEYLMPLLVTKDGDETLLHETHLCVVETQVRYGAENGIPWGTSESLFNLMDLSMTYQYRAFGVPGLGLKRDLDEDLVVTPYATALAAMVRPDLALANFEALEREGLGGRFGLYEAADYTPSRLPPGRRAVLVKAFMAHHQGMILVALDNVLSSGRMQRRFHTDPRVRATELLLEERVPVTAPITELRPAIVPVPVSEVTEPEIVERVVLDVGASPRAQVLGQGDISTTITSLGTGVVIWRGLDVSRFREDATLAPGGIAIYVRDKKTGQVWSAGYEPAHKVPDDYTASFFADHVEIRRRDGDVETVLEVVVSPESPAEVRRLTLINHGPGRRELEVTTYTEVVLATRAADRAHPTFSGMFIETEVLLPECALLAHRRPKNDEEPAAWVVQLFTPEEGTWTGADYDSSRKAFIGRGRELDCPMALERGALLPRNVGAVLDPALSLRRSVALKPGKTARLALTTALASERTVAERLLRQYADPAAIRRTFELARADVRVQMNHLGIGPEDGALFQRLFSAFVTRNARLRSGGGLEVEGGRGRSALWSFGISGDLPILVCRIDDGEFADLAGELLSAHEFLRLNGFSMDLVLLDEEPTGYTHPREDQARDLVRASIAKDSLDRSGGVFVLRSERMSDADRSLLLRAAHVVLSASKGSLSRQLRRAIEKPIPPARFIPPARPKSDGAARVVRPTLEFDNGIGGFDLASSEYVMVIGESKRPPMPWCNVVANAGGFGFVVSESGASFTWSENSQLHRLTPWSNDPVRDPSGELFFLRDDADGTVWPLTPQPGGSGEYLVRHGLGYSVFEGERAGIAHSLTVYVDRDRPVKMWRLRLENRGTSAKTLRAYGAVEWVLGGVRDRSSVSVATEWDRALSGIFATNPLDLHSARCAFFRTTSEVASFTADRTEFFGKNGVRARPASVERVAFSGRSGAGMDPCAALEVPILLEPGAHTEIFFLLGDAPTRKESRDLAVAFSDPSEAARAFDAATAFWRDLASQVHVETPDPAFDRLMNGWLLYQVTSCRLFARTGFYQSSGAYGFRDQLQDVMALFHSRPDLARAHLLRAAARQFAEGDVQHWWHPDTGEGIRTRCSDDMLWLPFATAAYVRATGDSAVLGEVVPFLDEKPLQPGETEVFGKPAVSTESGILYEHCVRAIDVAITSGPHGLPRMRGGDWNDGMNRVGGGDGGESVWLAWFLGKTLRDFGEIASQRGDQARASRWATEVDRLARAVRESAWDGEWFRRGYYADGAPLGSKLSEDCHVDAIAQSWAVISGLADVDRACRALDASEALLIDQGARVLSLLWPPFESKAEDPGYIRAYPAGVRENGGQYTHGVLWTVLARAMLGQGDRASALLSLLNPIGHGTPQSMERYGVEPYVLAGDVCAGPGKAGRGGWTWYTGAAGWMYRIGLENILGIRREGDHLVVSPCVPRNFQKYQVDYRHGASTYRLVIENPHGVSTGVIHARADGRELEEPRIALVDDGRRHEVRITLGAADIVSRAPGPGGMPTPSNSPTRDIRKAIGRTGT